MAAALAAWVPGSAARAQPQPQPQGEAIVPDSEFEAALPKVDGDLNAPLQPLQSFDTPAPPPADPELTAPLPPLSTFDVTTPTEHPDPDGNTMTTST